MGYETMPIGAGGGREVGRQEGGKEGGPGMWKWIE